MENLQSNNNIEGGFKALHNNYNCNHIVRIWLTFEAKSLFLHKLCRKIITVFNKSSQIRKVLWSQHVRPLGNVSGQRALTAFFFFTWYWELLNPHFCLILCSNGELEAELKRLVKWKQRMKSSHHLPVFHLVAWLWNLSHDWVLQRVTFLACLVIKRTCLNWNKSSFLLILLYCCWHNRPGVDVSLVCGIMQQSLLWRREMLAKLCQKLTVDFLRQKMSNLNKFITYNDLTDEICDIITLIMTNKMVLGYFSPEAPCNVKCIWNL